MKPGEIRCWRSGATLTVAMADGRGSGREGLLVTSNGEVWAARRDADVAAVVEAARVAGLRPRRRAAAARLEPEWRLPLAWARSARIPAGRTVAKPAARTTAMVPFARRDGQGHVTYAGFDAYRKRSAHSLPALHEMIDEALARCAAAWDWECDGLEVKFHEDDRHLGLAYEPGSGALTGSRRISLNVRLLEQYTLESVERTVLHELCHHYREETWPRRFDKDRDPHDRLFCQELGRVDPLVTPDGGEECANFAEFTDPALVAALFARRSSKAPRRPPRPPVWAPQAGVVVLDHYSDRRIRLEWKPRRDRGFRWARWVGPLYAERLLDLAQRFAPADWDAIEVTAPGWPARGDVLPPGSLGALLRTLVRKYPDALETVAAYVRAVDEGSTA